ncbi:pilus assembly FimT family protein [Aquifex aeolicus]|uniref:Uncharacterized protein aq_2118 n=1 Tax=Aquifex aeolicus (strain VF5) TaxID=224324 RepID=Y2118_AQUAE|nr:type II secretion system protein [Aquifex aeolicus]O67882.1 RecName: Full=Uncharacterized protein aq_2118; Flags: Precursor [Aquifex aeolicus VF5]AAC07856.1 putative protein [Aquifex aeolicus VF5]
MERKLSQRAGNTFKGFTLVEVLITLAIISLVFSLILISFQRATFFTFGAKKEAERLKSEALLFWELQRSLAGAKKLKINQGKELFLITSGGSLYRGVVKKGFIHKDGWLYLYEFPYPSGSIDFYEEEKLVKLAKLDDFKVFALDSLGKHENYEGLPPFVIVELNSKEFTFKVR